MMKTIETLFVLGHCDEALDAKLATWRAAGLTEDDIDKLLINIPKGVMDTLKSGDKLFTQTEMTKARNDVRRQVESNNKHKTKNQTTPEEEDEDEEDEDTTQTPTPKPKAKTSRVSEIDIKNLVADAIREATQPLLDKNTQLEQQLTNVHDSLKTDKQKAYDKRKAELLAQLPEETHALLTGKDIEALEASFATVKSFVDKTVQEAKASVSAEVQTKEKDKAVIYKAKDGTEFFNINDIMAKGDTYWAEYKLSLG